MWRAISKIGILSSPQINKIFREHFSGAENLFERLTGIFEGTIALKGRPRLLDCVDATIRYLISIFKIENNL